MRCRQLQPCCVAANSIPRGVHCHQRKVCDFRGRIQIPSRWHVTCRLLRYIIRYVLVLYPVMFVYSCSFCICRCFFFQIASIFAFVLCCSLHKEIFGKFNIIVWSFPFRKGCKTAEEIFAMPAVQVVSQIEASKSSVQEIKNKRQHKEELGRRVCVYVCVCLYVCLWACAHMTWTQRNSFWKLKTLVPERHLYF